MSGCVVVAHVPEVHPGRRGPKRPLVGLLAKGQTKSGGVNLARGWTAVRFFVSERGARRAAAGLPGGALFVVVPVSALCRKPEAVEPFLKGGEA